MVLIGKNCLVGMNAVIMDNVELGDECIIGALTFIKQDEKYWQARLWQPGKIIKQVTDEMLSWKTEGTKLYQSLPKKCLKAGRSVNRLETPITFLTDKDYKPLKVIFHSKNFLRHQWESCNLIFLSTKSNLCMKKSTFGPSSWYSKFSPFFANDRFAFVITICNQLSGWNALRKLDLKVVSSLLFY
jgi:hypothetical protein